jgi:hypothetical protein
MKKKILIGVKCILGLGWLAVVMYFGISMFMGNEAWVGKIFIDQNIETNKKFTGGDPLKEVENQDYTTVIHEPVYTGIFTHSKEPFIQVDWLSHSELPPLIEETLDITGDDIPDISVKIDTKALSIEYEALREDIKGLLSKESLADIRAYTSKNAYDGLFYYHNKDLGGEIFEEGVTTRIIFDRAID